MASSQNTKECLTIHQILQFLSEIYHQLCHHCPTAQFTHAEDHQI
jgi:hypothetical protein